MVVHFKPFSLQQLIALCNCQRGWIFKYHYRTNNEHTWNRRGWNCRQSCRSWHRCCLCCRSRRGTYTDRHRVIQRRQRNSRSRSRILVTCRALANLRTCDTTKFLKHSKTFIWHQWCILPSTEHF